MRITSQKPVSPAKATEVELISAARGGDHKAFTELVRRYEDTVYRFSYKVCRDKEKASETMQDTFINVFRKLSSFDGKSKFSTWLFSIVTNNCLMKHRRTKMSQLEDSLEEIEQKGTDGDQRETGRFARWDETPADLLLDKELRESLDDAVQQLPVLYRAVFIMRDVEGQSIEETARALKISVEATKSRLRRARAFLRDKLDAYMHQHS
jgi:RNA polymerase sigma-70 factor, ECF subfamily